MSEYITVYEAGARSESGTYSKFIESNDESKVDEYIKIMKLSVSEGLTIEKLVKLYSCISTTTQIINKEQTNENTR